VIHILPAGSQFDLNSRSLLAHQTPVPDPEVVEAQAAEADLREVARDIAAEGVTPRNYTRRVRRNRRR
jgi:cyanophycinase